MGYDETSVIASLPPGLKTEVSLYLKRDVIEKVPLFKGASDAFIREIALEVHPVVYLSGDYVFRAGDLAHEMYFVTSGELEVVSKDGATVYTTLKEGDFFGEIALFRNAPRTASVRATRPCDLSRLDKETFGRVLAHFPEVAARIEAMASERETRS